MQIYLVGGAVRDELLGLPVKEKDWVVVGATPEDMLRLRYKQVGKEFPVFLHPDTAEEYALARTERKVAPGYAGFIFDTSPDVTLEEDLMRRDLTINAMAKTTEGKIVDPYHGQEDLKNKMLRHVSFAFSEDPVRILRIARFAARYADLGFTVAPQTNQLMQEMVAKGEVDALVAERVWKELERALSENSPDIFFKVLAECDALNILFPMIKVDDPTIKALRLATKLTNDTKVRFAVLMHALKEGDIDWICKRYRLPADYKELAALVNRYYPEVLYFNSLTPEEILDIFMTGDAFRREERFNKFLLACDAIAKLKEKSISKNIKPMLKQIKQIDVKEFLAQGLKDQQIADSLKQARLKKIAMLR